MSRQLVFTLVLALAGCSKSPDLPDAVVRAAHAGELTDFRADMGTRFPAERLKEFDTALDELKLDAMNRGVATAADREQDMLAAVNGKTVHEALLLGWTARRNRLLREIAELTRMLEHDLQQKSRTAATGTPESVISRIRSEKEVLDQLHRNLADTEHRLAELSQPKP